VFAHLRCQEPLFVFAGRGPTGGAFYGGGGAEDAAAALTDTNGLYAAVPFYQAAKTTGVKPIVGVTLDVEWRSAQVGNSMEALKGENALRFRPCHSSPLGAAESAASERAARQPLQLFDGLAQPRPQRLWQIRVRLLHRQSLRNGGAAD
jgi:hypothetical protein